jgi:hypothetical protein
MFYLELLGSAVTLASMWMSGNKSLWYPALGMLACLILGGIFIYTAQYGLLPLEGVAFILYLRVAYLWRKDGTDNYAGDSTKT